MNDWMDNFELCLQQLQSWDPAIRAQACAELGQSADSRAVESLMERLRPGTEVVTIGNSITVRERPAEPEDLVRQSICAALGQLKDARALDLLIEQLSHANSAVRQTAAASLGLLADPRAIDPLVASLSDEAVCSAAAESLAALGAQSIPALAAKLASANEPLRQIICELFGRVRDAKAQAALIGRLGDQSAAVRQKALESLRSSGETRLAKAVTLTFARDAKASDELAQLKSAKDSRLVDPFIALLSIAESELRQTLCDALGAFGDIRATDALVSQAADESEQVRLAACRALAAIGDRRAVPALIKRLTDSSTEVRLLAIATFGRWNERSAAKPIRARLADESWQVREAASAVLGKLEDASAVPALLAVLADDRAEVQQAAWTTLIGLRQFRIAQAMMDLLTGQRNAPAELARLAAEGELRALEPLQQWLDNPRTLPAATSALEAIVKSLKPHSATLPANMLTNLRARLAAVKSPPVK